MRFAHLSLFVWDFEASRRFYKDTVGLPVQHQNDQVCVFEVQGFRLVLIPPTRWKGGPKEDANFVNSHGEIGLEVEDVNRLAERLRTQGIAFEGPTTTPWGHYQIELKDPDGVVVELYERDCKARAR